MKVNRWRRKAAGKAIITASLQMSSNHNIMLRFSHLEWGDDLLTPKEQRYLEQLHKRLHEDAQLVLKFGQRLCK